MSAIAAESPIDVGALARRLRFPALLLAVAFALVTLLAAIGHETGSSAYDPRSTAPEGTHALAALLAERGTTITLATTTGQLASTADTTIVVSDPDRLSVAALRAIAATTSTVVLLDPSAVALRIFQLQADPDATTSSATTEVPSCGLPAAVTAGTIRMSGDLYATPPTAAITRCYIQQGDAALLQLPRANQATTTVFGSPSAFSNAHLAADGDAALALGLLNTATVQWVPGALDTGPATGSHRGLFNLLPSRLLWATLQLFVAMLLVALWRARRLGAPVVEPLPVVVRAAETVEGRGRLMRAAKSRGLAAQSLRAATIRRVSRAIRVGDTEERAAVVELVAERTASSPAEIDDVLYGGDPPDDTALVQLAQRLPTIESAVRQDGTPPSGARP